MFKRESRVSYKKFK